MIGAQMRTFMQEVLEFAERSGELKIHFASAREAFNMVIAAVDGHSGNPHYYRDYKLREIMKESHFQEREEREPASVLG